MPADKSKPADKVDAVDSVDAVDAAEADTVETEDVPMNRAERRAKHKAGGKPKVVAKMEPKNVNSGPAPRQWANRRSG